MIKFILRRLLQSIPTLFGITLLSFFMMVLAPGGPESLTRGDPRVNSRQQQALLERMGVTAPWYEQYIIWLIGNDWRAYDYDHDGEIDGYGTRRGILRGDFGFSLFERRPIVDMIGERVVPTLELGSLSLFFGLVFGITIGILAAVWQGSWFDNFTRVLAVIVTSVPIFWLGLVLIIIFGVWLDLLPMGNRCPLSLTGTCAPIYERLNHLLLPVLVLSAGGIAGYSRFMRASMLEVINQDYMRTAKSKGLSNRAVWFRHGARNAMIPIATFLGPAIAGLLGGAPVTEQIFSWPGLGQLALQSVFRQDYPVVMTIVIMATIATVVGFILSDVMYAIIDPRIRFD